MNESIFQEPQVTQLIVEKQSDFKGKNASNGELFGIKDIQLSRRVVDSLSYYKVSNLSRTQAVEVVMRNGSEKVKVALPETMLGRIAEYIRTQHTRNEPFDCASFAHFVNGIPYEFSKFNEANWEFKPLDEQGISPGDTVCISQDKNHRLITHMAVFLGDGLYLSKFGSSGKLIATSMEEMQKGFGGGFTFQTVPNIENG